MASDYDGKRSPGMDCCPFSLLDVIFFTMILMIHGFSTLLCNLPEQVSLEQDEIIILYPYSEDDFYSLSEPQGPMLLNTLHK